MTAAKCRFCGSKATQLSAGIYGNVRFNGEDNLGFRCDNPDCDMIFGAPVGDGTAHRMRGLLTLDGLPLVP
jgi:hypothetical protein